MKQMHLLTLLQDNFVTVKVQFQRREENTGTPRSGVWSDACNFGTKKYTYKALRGLNLVAGDHVIVPAAGGMAVVKVADIDENLDIDLDANHEYQWVVQKLDTTVYDRLQKEAKEFYEVQLAVEREKQRKTFQDAYIKDLPPESPARLKFEKLMESCQQTVAMLPGSVAPPPPCGGTIPSAQAAGTSSAKPDTNEA